MIGRGSAAPALSEVIVVMALLPTPCRRLRPMPLRISTGEQTKLLKLGPDLAVERIGSAAAQRNGEADPAPQHAVFVAALQPGKAALPVDRGDDQHLDRRSGGKEACEQAKDQREAG